jgi:hypothetical protein
VRRLDIKRSNTGVWAVHDVNGALIFHSGISVKYAKPDLVFIAGTLYVWMQDSDIIFLESVKYPAMTGGASRVIMGDQLIKFVHLTRGMDIVQKILYCISTM